MAIRISTSTISFTAAGIAADGFPASNVALRRKPQQPWRSADTNAIDLTLTPARNPRALLIERTNAQAQIVAGGVTYSPTYRIDPLDFRFRGLVDFGVQVAGDIIVRFRPGDLVTRSDTFFAAGRILLIRNWYELSKDPDVPWRANLLRPLDEETIDGETQAIQARDTLITDNWSIHTDNLEDIAIARRWAAADPNALYAVDYQSDDVGVYAMHPIRSDVGLESGRLARINVRWEQR